MAERKNIILISIDDGIAFWRYRHVFGPALLTPNLDRMAEAATAFTSAYCQVPICGPSRASMLTGLSPFETGIFDNYTRLYDVVRPDHLWQFRLRQSGYHCSTAGKVHHAFGPQPPVLHDVLYSHPPKPLNIAPPRGKATPVRKFGGMGGGPGTTRPEDDALYYDHQSASDAIAFLERHDSAAPFYREIGFLHPHLPYKTPVRFKEMYDETAFAYPEAWSKGFDLAAFPQAFIGENFPTEDLSEWQKSVRNYFSAYSHMDYHLGRVWDALQASPHARNTIVVLFADHGYHLGDKRRFRKSTLYEECTRVPLLIWDPDANGGEVDDPVGLIDIGPTILDYAGCPPLGWTHGRSLRPAVSTKRADPDRAVPSFKFASVGLRKGPWRITLYPDGSSEFHDVEQDMWLTENLAHRHPDYDDAARELVSVAADWGLDLGSALQGPGRPRALPATRRMPGAPGAVADRVFSTDLAPGGSAAGRPCDCTEYVTGLSPDSHIALSAATRAVRRGSEGAGTVERLRLTGNANNNDITLVAGRGHYTVEIDTGPGDNTILASHERLDVRCGRGNNRVTAAGGGIVRGGSGSDTLRSGALETELHGGSGGENMLVAGSGPTTIYSGWGNCRIRSGDGATRIIVEGGRNTVDARRGQPSLTVRRTGMPQTIRLGTAEPEIDLSDWTGLGPAVLRAEGDGLVVECGTERLVFLGATPDRLRRAIHGVTLESDTGFAQDAPTEGADA